jgi:hypothetical protein
MVQAIASQTLRNVTDRDAVYAFERVNGGVKPDQRAAQK